MLKLSIPIINGSNGRFGFKNLSGYPLIVLLDSLIHFFLLNGKMTFLKSARIVPSITMLLNLMLRSCHNICNSVDKPLVLSLHIISLEIWHPIIIIRRSPQSITPSGFNHGFTLSQISVVPSFVLKVQKLLCFLYVH